MASCESTQMRKARTASNLSFTFSSSGWEQLKGSN